MRTPANLNRDPEPDLTVRQVAAELQVDVSSVYAMIRERVLPAYSPLGRGIDDEASRRALRVTRQALDQHKLGNLAGADPQPGEVPPLKRRPRLGNGDEHQAAMDRMRARGLV